MRRLSALIVESPLFARMVRLGLATPEGDINETEWFERTRVREPEAPTTEKITNSVRELQYLREGTSSTSTSTSVQSSTSTKKKTAAAPKTAQNSTASAADGRTRVRPFSDPVAGQTAKSFVAWFTAQYRQKRGVEFFPEYGRDTKLAKTLIERYGYEHLQAMALAMLDASEDFWMMRGNRDLRQLLNRAPFVDKWVRDQR